MIHNKPIVVIVVIVVGLHNTSKVNKKFTLFVVGDNNNNACQKQNKTTIKLSPRKDPHMMDKNYNSGKQK